MPVVTSDILELTLAGIKTEFDQAYIKRQEDADWKLIATEIPTTLPTQNYAWLGRGAVMEEWKDRAVEQGVFESTYQLSDKTWVADLVVDRKAIEDDQYGLLMLRGQELGGEPVRHWDELAYTGLPLGFTTMCYDGQYFFDAEHQQGDSPIQSNISTALLSDAALTTAEATMMAYRDDKNKPLAIKPNLLVVGPSQARMGADLLGSEVIVHVPGDGAVGAGATAYTPYNNYFKGRYRLHVSPYLTGAYANYWMLLDTTKVIKPILIQNRSDVPVTFETDMIEPGARLRGKYNIFVRGRYVQGYGLWQTAFGSTGAG